MGDKVGNAEARTSILRRRPAAMRLYNTTIYVCPVGWSSKVFELSGSAAAVWQSLGSFETLGEIASDQGVDESDEMLTEAVEALLKSGLLRLVAQT